MLKIKKGDQVKILRGKDKGRTGVVEKVVPGENQVVISGVNVVKKHVKRQGEKQPGGIVEIAKPLDLSKVALLCPKCNQPTRVAFKKMGESKKRVCKKCKEIL